jgi:nicotinate-nucleotide pyrophosphorylase (carboxylating)
MNYNTLIIEKKLREFLLEDCSYNDVSSTVIPKNAQTSAKIVAKSAGYISGLEILKVLFGKILNLIINILKEDGEEVSEGDVIAELKGNTRDILLGERTGLNVLTRMSAITSTSRKFVKLIKDSGKNVKIACTRKTTPGVRIFEKMAAEIGLADVHRFSLDDMILLKDTHLRFFEDDVEKLLKAIKEKVSFTKKIEIEVETVKDALIAAKYGADIIMLDNFNPDMVEDTINSLKKYDLRNKVIIEVSGGITPENVVDYLLAEPDVISSGFLTQFPSEKVDFSLRFD